MAISKEKKRQLVTEIVEKLSRSKAIVFTDYRGLTVEDMDTLRNNLRNEGIDLKIIKNTLFKRALDEAGIDIELSEMEGHPIAVAFGYGDEVGPAKITYEFSKKNENLELLGGMLEGKEINAISVKSLAKLPSRDELYAKIVGSIAAPMTGMVTVLTGNISGLLNVLKAYQEKIN
jgi:large subunit ribosomal protein L10